MNTYSASAPDLVDQVFGKIVSVRLASLILLTFLSSNLLTVELDGKELIRDHWPEACASAATLAASSSDGTKKNYLWKWCKVLNEDTVPGVEIFLNIVGLSAYIAAMTSGAAEELSNRKVTTRFATLPCSYGPLPVPTASNSSYSPPDFFVLPSTSFVSKNAPDAKCRPEELLEKPSPLSIIKEKFPFVLRRFPRLLSNIMNHHESRHQAGFLAQSNQTGNHAPPSHGTMSIRDELIAFAASFDADVQPALPGVEQILREESERCFLDLSRVCAPEVLLSGTMDVEICQERVQTMMQHQRRFQPWLRSLLGLAITKDDLGLFRADAAGLQDCIFDRTTGFGVIQCIRIALGIVVATNEELGIHPAFSFRETVSKPLLKRIGSSVDREMPPCKKARTAGDEYRVSSMERSRNPSKPRLYRYKEANFCTLENSSLRFPRVNTIEPQVKYYVRYLLHDEGSLLGRSTRVWCVYKEVLDEDRGKYAQENGVVKNTPLFVGPFALKMYNADVDNQAYKYDLVQKAIAANVRYVVLPKHIWYLGRVHDLGSGGYLQSHDFADDYEEIMMISPFKRTLTQFSDADEFHRGIIDALKGIEALENAGLMHCDVSIDNILLEAETPASKDVVESVTFSLDGVAEIEIALLFQPSGSDGGLHDLDCLEQVPDDEKSDREAEKSKRVGTFPFMSIECLDGKKRTVIDDIHSLFYVLYLSMFQLAGPVPNCYPSVPKPVTFEYPREVEEWASGELVAFRARTNEEVYTIARIKKSWFFESQYQTMPYAPWFLTAANQSLPFWRDNFGAHRFFLRAFHETLWFKAISDQPKMIWERRENDIISPRTLIETLETIEGALRHILKDVK